MLIWARESLSFKPLELDDLPLLLDWLHAPHVSAWWSEAQEAIRSIESHINDANINSFLICLNKQAIGYIQCCLLDPDKDEAFHLSGLPLGTIGIDLFIGKVEKTKIGLGPRILMLMMEDLFAKGVPLVLVDPHPENRNAIRAYEKAGFSPFKTVYPESGPVSLMIRNRKEF